MSTTAKNNRTKQQAADRKLIDGVRKHATTIPSVVIAGQTIKAEDFIALVQTRLVAASGVEPARAAWQAAVQASREAQARTKAVMAGYRQVIAVAFAESIDDLADFGMKPRKKGVVSPEKKLAATAKAKATRAARHTVGKKQKLAIKGSLPPTATTGPAGAT